MIESIAAVIGGLILLTYGADRFVEGAAATASNLGVPPLLVGLIIVGFATSAPEMLVSTVAAIQGNPTLGIGNAIGSNITNVALVLGATALVMPLTVQSAVLRREFPLMFVVLLGASALLLDQHLGRVDGVILAVGLVVIIGLTTRLGMQARESDPLVEELGKEHGDSLPARRALFWLVAGLALLLGGSKLLVTGAVNIAQQFGISDVVIGLTIVAIGTSLPELAASVMSALKGEPDIALGNILGSNMFNALAVLAPPALIRPTYFEAEVVVRDIPLMLGLSAALYVMAWARRKPGTISRWEGAALLAVFVAYQYTLFSPVA